MEVSEVSEVGKQVRNLMITYVFLTFLTSYSEKTRQGVDGSLARLPASARTRESARPRETATKSFLGGEGGVVGKMIDIASNSAFPTSSEVGKR